MKVCVTGASGFVGQEVMRQLHDAGHHARFLSHHPGSELDRQFESQYGAESIHGDVLGSLDELIKGCEAAIHLVGIISEVGRKTFENIHTLGTTNMVAAGRRARVARFVHMSALGTRPDAVSRYHKSKWLAEDAVRDSGLEFTIFRPSLIYGPKDHFVNLFAKIIRWSPVVPILGRADARFQPVPVEDVARSFVKAFAEPASVGKTFDLCGVETLTMPGMIDAMLTVMRRRRLKWKVPSRIANAQAAFLEVVFPRLLRKAPPLNRDQLIMLREDNTGNGEPARELFGLSCTGFGEGIAQYLPGA